MSLSLSLLFGSRDLEEFDRNRCRNIISTSAWRIRIKTVSGNLLPQICFIFINLCWRNEGYEGYFANFPKMQKMVLPFKGKPCFLHFQNFFLEILQYPSSFSGKRWLSTMKHPLTESSVALLYFPHLEAHQATNHWRRWMINCPPLLKELYNAGNQKRQRQFDILKAHLGEP